MSEDKKTETPKEEVETTSAKETSLKALLPTKSYLTTSSLSLTKFRPCVSNCAKMLI